MQRLSGVSVIILIAAPSVWGQIFFDYTSFNKESGKVEKGAGLTDSYGSHFTRLSDWGNIYWGDISPDGDRVVGLFMKREMGYESRSIFWRTLDWSTYGWDLFIVSLGSVPFTPILQPLGPPIWSPFGDDLLAFAWEGNGIWVINLAGVVIRKIPEEILGGGIIAHIAWAPMGRFIYSTIDSEIWFTDGRTSRFLSEGQYPDVSPDGKKIAVVISEDKDSYRNYPEINLSDHERSAWVLVDILGTHKKLIHTWRIGSNNVAWSPDSQELVFADGVRAYESAIKAVTLDGDVRTVLDVTPNQVHYVEWKGTQEPDIPTSIKPASWGEVKAAQ